MRHEKRYSLLGPGHHTRRRHWRTAMTTATRSALRTPLCDLLGITYPICQAGMGHEAGGHTGRIGGLVLIPAVIDAVSPVPVVAAGGIADGRGLAAALALGAVGVWLGTRFIATPEAYGHVNYKNKIVAIDEEGTIVTRAAS